MSTTDVLTALDRALSDECIIVDILQVLRESGESGVVAVELDGEIARVPVDPPVDVITKACFREKYGSGFGTYRVQVAIGGITDAAHGVLEATYCFATAYYDSDLHLTTIDFHRTPR